MTEQKTPTLLAVVIQSSLQQWFVAGIDTDGAVHTLVRSEPSNLDSYVGASPDEQLSFLRHRLSSAMQRGCDRLWARNRKASHIIVLADDDLPDSDPELLARLAEHLHTWMTRPPVSCFRGRGSMETLGDLQCLIGELPQDEAETLDRALPSLLESMEQSDQWEVIAKPKA